MANYTRFYLYEKATNLLDYYKGKGMIADGKAPSNYMLKEHDDIQLKVYVRYENKTGAWGEIAGHRIMCLIDCPINPMPVKGEFEIPSWGALDAFLRKHGWQQKCYCTIK